MELLFMWKCLLQFLEKRKCSISVSYYGKIFYQNIMDGSKVTILNLLGKDKAGGTQDMTEPLQVWVMPYLLLEARWVTSFVEEIPCHQLVLWVKQKNPDSPGVWKIQKGKQQV